MLLVATACQDAVGTGRHSPVATRVGFASLMSIECKYPHYAMLIVNLIPAIAQDGVRFGFLHWEK